MGINNLISLATLSVVIEDKLSILVLALPTRE